MSTPRKILTVHSPIGADVVDELLTSIEGALTRLGAERVWIDPTSSYDLTIMAELPEGVRQPELAGAVPDARFGDDVAVADLA